MTRKTLGPAAVVSGTGPGDVYCSAAIDSPENTAASRAGQGVVDLQAWRLRQRFGVSDAVARLLSDHAFGERFQSFDNWIALGDVTTAAFEAHVGLRGFE